MTPVENVLALLHGVKKVGDSWTARCPAHDDQKPSLSISEGDDGKVLLTCHAGCELSAILKAICLEPASLFPTKHGHMAPISKWGKNPGVESFPSVKEAVAPLLQRFGKPSNIWIYHDANCEPVGYVVRWDRSGGKTIRPLAKHADGWRIGAMTSPRPLYRLSELTKDKLVLICEGEKAAESGRCIGFTTTTSSGGSKAAAKTDWSPLAGKEVWILPDNDAPGRGYAEEVATILAKLKPAPTIKIVELPGLPTGGDIADWIDQHGDAAEPEGMRSELTTLAQATQSRRPEEGEDLEFRPFPVDSLPEPFRRVVAEGAEAIGCDSSFLALPLLVAAASAIGDSRRLQLKKGWSVPPIIWGAIVGDSGTAKTPAFKLVMQPFRDRQEKAFELQKEDLEQYKTDLTFWEKKMAAWKHSKIESDPPPKPETPLAERLIVNDTTVEALAPILSANPRGLLLARDELAGWLGSFDRYAAKGKAGADAANWLSMFNAETVIVDRKSANPPTIHIPHASICVIGGIQPAILKRALGVEHRDSGLAARLLLSYPPRKAKQWTEADIDPELEVQLAQVVVRLYELQPTINNDGKRRPVFVELSAEAKANWIAYFNSHAKEQADFTGDMAAAWSKLEEYAARLALVIHFARWAAKDSTLAKDDEVDASSMETAIRLTQWFKHEARRVYAMLNETDADCDQRRLIEWIDRKGGSVSTREVQQGCRWLKAPGLAASALDGLAKSGCGSWQEPTPGARGRPTGRFQLSRVSTVHDKTDGAGKTALS